MLFWLRMELALESAMIRILKASVLIVPLVAFDAPALRGQTASSAPPDPSRSSSPAAPIFSIGQPPIWRQQLTAQGTAFGQGDRSGATVSYGVFHSLNKPPIQALNPLLGLIGGTLEGYGTIGGMEDAGVRAMATSRLFATSIGAEWDIRHHHVNTILSWQSAIRRGGLLGRGSMLRVDWIPARGRTVRVGLTAPLFQPLAGRTRPRETSVTIPDPPQPPVQPIATRDVATQRLARDLFQFIDGALEQGVELIRLAEEVALVVRDELRQSCRTQQDPVYSPPQQCSQAADGFEALVCNEHLFTLLCHA